MKLSEIRTLADKLESQEEQIHALMIENDQLKKHIASLSDGTAKEFVLPHGAQVDIELARISIQKRSGRLNYTLNQGGKIMPACMGTTQEVNDLCTAAKEAGFTVEKTDETAMIFDGGGTIIYRGIKKGSTDAWIVRFNAAFFEKREGDLHANA